MDLLDYNEKNLGIISGLILKNLTYDLLPRKWWGKNSTNPLFGHCHNATGCLYKIFGYKAMHTYKALDYEGVWHWWALDKENKIIDLTAGQYTSRGKNPPYAEGNKASLLGFEYRKRIVRLTDRVMCEYESSDNNGSTFWSQE